MLYAAFYRNLNLGRPNCPTRAQFEQAFLDAGAVEATSFLTNGTLVFALRGRTSAKAVLARAGKNLHAACGLVEPGFVRTVPYLARLVQSEPFKGIDPASVYALCITFLEPGPGWPPRAMKPPGRGDVQLVQITGSEVLSLSLMVGNTPGSPNAYLEKTLGLPATSRNWNTVTRLVDRFGGRLAKPPAVGP